MNKFVKAAVLPAVLLLSVRAAFAEVTVTVDDEVLSFGDQPPVIVNDRTYVPLRKIFESLGAYVEWDNDTKTVFAHKRMKTVSMTVGELDYYVDGEVKTLDTPAMIINDRTMIPVRAVSEALGAEVLWNAPNKTVAISGRYDTHQIRDIYLDFWESDEDGRVLLTGRVAYPEIISEVTEIAAAFNEFMEGDAEEVCDTAVIEFLPYAVESSVQEGFLPYMFERNFDVTYDRNNLISMYFVNSSFTGGAHPNYYMYAMTYNLETGKLLDVTDVLDSDEQSIRAEVRSEFEELIADNPESFFGDALECLDEALAELGWYLAEDGVHFFVNPYMIAPYASGVVEVIIPANA